MQVTGISGSLSVGMSGIPASGAAASGVTSSGTVAAGATTDAGAPIAADGSVLVSGGAILPPTIQPSLSSLMELMQGFSTAELLIAMMMAAGGGSDDDDESGSAAMGLLAGLAMAGQGMPQMELQWQLNVTGAYADGASGVGGGIDVSV
jgi:hypothetical protein